MSPPRKFRAIVTAEELPLAGRIVRPGDREPKPASRRCLVPGCHRKVRPVRVELPRGAGLTKGGICRPCWTSLPEELRAANLSASRAWKACWRSPEPPDREEILRTGRALRDTFEACLDVAAVARPRGRTPRCPSCGAASEAWRELGWRCPACRSRWGPI